jgi:hypothetical protein
VGTRRLLQICSHTRGSPNLEVLIFHSNLIGECFNACSRSCDRFNCSWEILLRHSGAREVSTGAADRNATETQSA